MVRTSGEAMMLSDVMMKKILHRFNAQIYLKEIHRKRQGYCIDYLVEEAILTCRQVYEVRHDPGDSKQISTANEDGNEEPPPPGKDTVTPASLKVDEEKALSGKKTKTITITKVDSH